MTINEIGVSPKRILGLQKDYAWKVIIAEENNDEQFFTAFEAFLKANYHQKNELIEKVLGRVKSKSFIVGEVFQQQKQNFIPQYFGDNFRTILWEPSQEKKVSLKSSGTKFLKKFILPQNMGCNRIQENTDSVDMGVDQFWAVLYLLIIEPKIGKKVLGYELKRNRRVYIFHVKLDSGVTISVGVDWDEERWNFKAYSFFDEGLWAAGRTFLYFPVD